CRLPPLPPGQGTSRLPLGSRTAHTAHLPLAPPARSLTVTRPKLSRTPPATLSHTACNRRSNAPPPTSRARPPRGPPPPPPRPNALAPPAPPPSRVPPYGHWTEQTRPATTSGLRHFSRNFSGMPSAAATSWEATGRPPLRSRNTRARRA